MELLIIGQNGWKKPVKLEKAITRVGSSPTSDIQLESVQVAPVQLQILYAPDAPSHCKVVNLAGEVEMVINTPYGNSGPRIDGYEIRAAAVPRDMPCITTIQGAAAAVATA